MNDAEQFLADMEAKAKAATPGPWQSGVVLRRGYAATAILDSDGNNVTDMENSQFTRDEEELNAAFIAAANPAAVLRLVSMVRHLAVGCDCDAEPCQYGHCTPTCRLKMAYTATEER